MKNSLRSKFSFDFLKNGKLLTSTFIVSMFLLTTYSQIALSANKQNSAKVAVKCHVLLVDGKQMISLWSIQQNQLKKLKDNIIGKKILPLESIQRVKIYQAYECVLEDDAFESTKARLLDSKTPR